MRNAKLKLWRGGISAAWALLAFGCAGGAAYERPAPETSERPVLMADFPDPFVLPVDDSFYAYATNTKRNGQRVNVQVARSDDLRNWALLPDAMPILPEWVRSDGPDIWAPEVIEAAGDYVLYFTARHAEVRRPDGRTLCVGVATAAAPQGPFVAEDEPLVCDGLRYGAIDPSPFRDDQDLYLYVKTDGNCCGERTRFLVQKLAPNGHDPVGPLVEVAGVVNDLAWEGKVVEAPTMVKQDGDYFLFFSANDYGGRHYAIGYAHCEGPMGPCEDAPANPILASEPEAAAPLIGPGHQSIFEANGAKWIAYHGWQRPAEGKRRFRAMYIDPLSWRGGEPLIGR